MVWDFPLRRMSSVHLKGQLWCWGPAEHPMAIPPLLTPCPVLQHYTEQQGALCTKLVKPKAKSGMKSAEKELAKGGKG